MPSGPPSTNPGLSSSTELAQGADWNCVKVERTLRRYWRSLISLAGSVRLRWFSEVTLVKTVRKPSALLRQSIAQAGEDDRICP